MFAEPCVSSAVGLIRSTSCTSYHFRTGKDRSSQLCRSTSDPSFLDRPEQIINLPHDPFRLLNRSTAIIASVRGLHDGGTAKAATIGDQEARSFEI